MIRIQFDRNNGTPTGDRWEQEVPTLDDARRTLTHHADSGQRVTAYFYEGDAYLGTGIAGGGEVKTSF